MRSSILAWAILALAAPAFAQEDSYRGGRIRHVEGGVTYQNAYESSAEEAAPNMPFVPGDRLWSDGDGRAEIQFGSGVVRLDVASKLDCVGDGRDGASVLRLWSGSLFLHVSFDDAGFEVETPDGVVTADERGVYRIDADRGATWLSVYEGNATLEAGRRRVRVGPGERTSARGGEPPREMRRFDPRDSDDFAAWDQEREQGLAWAGDSRRYLPDEVAPYAGELQGHGSWYFENDVGYVWRPYVAAGWRPYCNGRWLWTAYGWTWLPYDGWGWAPFHYGRWGYGPSLGWYWIPGRQWGPAWVHWAVGGDYVGWAPLGHHDRPVLLPEGGGRRAVPRGSVARDAREGAPRSGENLAWVFARRNEMTSRELAKKIDTSPDRITAVRVLESPEVQPSRDLREVVRAMGRGRTATAKPTPGDFIPELHDDNRVTIPRPVPRRDREVERQEQSGGAGAERRDREIERRDATTGAGTPSRVSPIERRPETTRPADREQDARPRNREQDTRPSNPDQDVLRKFFQPATEPRPATRVEREGENGRSRHEAEAPRGEPRSEPRRVEPQRSEPRRVEPQRSEPRRVEPQRSEPRRGESQRTSQPHATATAKPRDKDKP